MLQIETQIVYLHIAHLTRNKTNSRNLIQYDGLFTSTLQWNGYISSIPNHPVKINTFSYISSEMMKGDDAFISRS